MGSYVENLNIEHAIVSRFLPDISHTLQSREKGIRYGEFAFEILRNNDATVPKCLQST